VQRNREARGEVKLREVLKLILKEKYKLISTMTMTQKKERLMIQERQGTGMTASS
jgi:hypothetical protein